jgi:hypothetical protein
VGLGVNASNDPNLKEVHVAGQHFQISSLPWAINEEEVAGIKADFRDWIVGNGFRELDQGLNLFLTGLHSLAMQVLTALGKIEAKQAEQGQKKFDQQTNTARKANDLATLFKCSIAQLTYLDSLSKARNSLTHSFGIVLQRHCNQAGKLTVSWLGVDFVFETAASKISIRPQDFKPFTTSAETTVGIQFVDRAKSFGLNEHITFEPIDLAEFCWMYGEIARLFIVAFTEVFHAKKGKGK